MMLSVSAFFILAATADDQLACRSMQSEAKGNLKALYVAEEAHRAEFDTYSTDFTKLGFKPSAAKPRYSYEVKSANAAKFTAEASGSLNGRSDLWRINESNNLVNIVNGCGDFSSTSNAGSNDPAKEANELWATRCTTCHGPEGRGDGVAASALTPRPRDYKNALWQGQVADAFLAKVILEGGASVGLSPLATANPDLKTKPAVVAALVAKIRSFAKPSASNSPWQAADPALREPFIFKPLASFTLKETYCHLYPRYTAITVGLPDAGGEQVIIYNDGNSAPAPSRCDPQSIKPIRLEPFSGVFAGIAGDAALLDEGTTNIRALRVFQLPGGKERITAPFDSNGEFSVVGNTLLCPNVPLSPSDKRPVQPPKCRPRTAAQGAGYEEELRASKRIDLKNFTSSIDKVRCEYIFHE